MHDTRLTCGCNRTMIIAGVTVPLLILGAVFFTIQPVLVGIIMAVLAIALMYGIVRLVPPLEHLRLGAGGLREKTVLKTYDEIPWDAIEHVEVVGEGHAVGLLFDDTCKHLRAANANYGMDYVLHDTYRMKPMELAALLVQWRNAVAPRIATNPVHQVLAQAQAQAAAAPGVYAEQAQRFLLPELALRQVEPPS